MIKIVLLIVFSLPSYAALELDKKWQIDLLSTLKSQQESYGISARYFLTDRFDINITRSVEVTGFASTLGARYYTGPAGDKCYFVIDCQARYYLGLQVGITESGSISQNSGDSKYSVRSGQYYQMVLGYFNIYADQYVFSADINYNTFVAEPVSKIKRGDRSEAVRDTISQYFSSGLGVGLSFGYLF